MDQDCLCPRPGKTLSTGRRAGPATLLRCHVDLAGAASHACRTGSHTVGGAHCPLGMVFRGASRTALGPQQGQGDWCGRAPRARPIRAAWQWRGCRSVRAETEPWADSTMAAPRAGAEASSGPRGAEGHRPPPQLRSSPGRACFRNLVDTYPSVQ
uniref:Uncharacterized protein n=1 Tax=Molossus molossus TaxID=27622 RepID=A0A7J8EE76_MOLMO|nr:hypothetical protein HJG59_008838 [Molossus molossus]